MREADRKRIADCPGCLTMCSEAFALACGHTFCRECIRGLFLTAIKDKTYMPVRCCGRRIDQRLRREVLTLSELDKFEMEQLDVELPRKMYCPKKGCGKLYNLDLVASTFTCTQCQLQLCAPCRASHPSLNCAQYQTLPLSEKSIEDVQFLEAARNERYARCNKCGRFVSRISGCDAMHCPCRHTFSYTQQRYTGPKHNTLFRCDFSSSSAQSVVPPAATEKCAYEIEEEPCAHEWGPCSSSLTKHICHLCRRDRLCYQSACTKCRMRSCAACRVKRSQMCVVV